MCRSDEDLMLSCRDGDEGAFEVLYRRYEKPIFSFIYRIVMSAADAEDLCQETFFKVGKTFTSVAQRFSEPESMPYKFEVVFVKESNAYHISKLEKKYHKELKEHKYKPLKHFHGCQECFCNIKDYGE